MANTFKARYQAQDGYVGGSRPKTFSISADELEDDMTKDDLIAFYEDAIQSHFEQNVTPGAERVDEFVEWAKQQLAARE